MTVSYNLILEAFTRAWGSEFHVLTLTKTMLNKGVIDVNQSLSKLWKYKKYSDIDSLERIKLKLKGVICSKEVCVRTTVSVYRPKGAKPDKRGDPRFWPYGLSRVANQNDKLAIFIVNKTAVMVVMNIELDPKKVINEVNSVLD